VTSFCKLHDIVDEEREGLLTQVVNHLSTQSSSAATSVGAVSPIDFKTQVDVKSKYGSAAKKHELSIVKGAGIDSSVRAFCKQYEVNDKECTTLSTQVTSYLLKQSGSAPVTAAAPAAAASAPAAGGAGTPSPIDFETKVDVKSKKGGPPRKETLKITRGAAIENQVRSFCQQYEVKDSECNPLIGQVTDYLLKQSPAAPAASSPGNAASAASPTNAEGSTTPSPIDFETMVTVKSKSKGTQSKQMLKITKGVSIEATVVTFCKLHDVTDPDCTPLTQQVVKYLSTRK